MKAIDLQQFQQLSAGATPLERDRHGDKVLLTPQGMVIKLFRTRKRRITSARLLPYARRFARNAQRLRDRGITTVEVRTIGFCAPIERYLVTYPLLRGETLRAKLAAAPDDSGVLESLAAFVAELHDKGIYFRGLHLGNVLQLEDGCFALIDVTDVQFARRRLGLLKRARNLRRLYRDPPDRAALQHFGQARFIDAYLRAATLPAMTQRVLRRVLQRKVFDVDAS